MRKVFCDGCGMELQEDNKVTLTPAGTFDLCPMCAARWEQLNLRNIVLDKLRDLAAPGPQEPGQEELSPPGNEPVQAIRGKYAKVKRAILEELDKLRPGEISEVAEKSGVRATDLHSIICREKVSIEVWKLVGCYLGVGWPD